MFIIDAEQILIWWVITLRDYDFKDVDDILIEDPDASYAVQDIIHSRKTPSVDGDWEDSEMEQPEQKKPEPVVEEKPAAPAAIKKPATKKNIVKKTVKKVAVKKASKKVSERSGNKSASNDSKNTWIVIAIVAVIIAVIAFLIYQFAYTPLVDTKASSTVAVLVNGEPIYDSDIEFRMGFMQSTINPFVTREAAIEDAINEKLLIQEAQKKGFSVTKQEAEKRLEDIISDAGKTMADFKEDLDSAGLDYEQVLAFYRARFVVFDFINKTLVSTSLVAEDEVQAYYDENKETFTVPEQVQVRHILIGFDDSPESETQKEAERVAGLITADRNNFCELVKEYTVDIASADTCGEYNFSESDPYVPEFVDAGFSMKPGEVRVVKTQFGYHIMYKVADLPERVVPFEEVKDQIGLFLEQQQAVDAYEELIQELRENALIERYGVETEDNSSASIEPEEADPIEVLEETPVVVNDATLAGFTKCLSDKEIKIFTVYWCPECKEQLNLFKDEAQNVLVVECDPEGEDSNPELCAEENVRTYPTWVIDGKQYTGMQSLAELSELSGCAYEG